MSCVPFSALETETGDYFFRARYYDSELGRFLGRDPLRYVDGWSLYRAYFVPDGVDPFGLWRSVCCTFQRKDGTTYNQGLVCDSGQSGAACCKQFLRGPLTTFNQNKDTLVGGAERRCREWWKPGRGFDIARARQNLWFLLEGTCGSCKCEPCTKEKCQEDAVRISNAIGNTIVNNRRLVFPRFVDHRHRGYYCYQWAYGFEDAINNLKSPCFTVKVNGVFATQARDLEHLWIEITSVCTKEIVAYVDDTYSNTDGTYVHTTVPNLGWTITGAVTRRSECTPVTPYR